MGDLIEACQTFTYNLQVLALGSIWELPWLYCLVPLVRKGLKAQTTHLEIPKSSHHSYHPEHESLLEI